MPNKSWKIGRKKERLYHVWLGMRNRCNNSRGQDYKYYGGRGIKVCSEWDDYLIFREWAYSSGYNPDAKVGKCTLDRIDTNGNYEPSNCRWVSIQEQQKNKRSPNMSKSERPVEQIDEAGNIVARFKGINTASRQTGIAVSNIVEVCKGRRMTAGGYSWRYINA